MKKKDLKLGYLVETKDKQLLTLLPIKNTGVFVDHKKKFYPLSAYTEDLCSVRPLQTIVKVWGKEMFGENVLSFETDTRDLLWERKETPTLTQDEKSVLRNIDEKYQYITRNIDNELWLYSGKPHNLQGIWFYHHEGRLYFDKLFQFIEWEDEEPYDIKELLNDER